MSVGADWRVDETGKEISHESTQREESKGTRMEASGTSRFKGKSGHPQRRHKSARRTRRAQCHIGQ